MTPGRTIIRVRWMRLGNRRHRIAQTVLLPADDQKVLGVDASPAFPSCDLLTAPYCSDAESGS